jgi:hypothetical protein
MEVNLMENLQLEQLATSVNTTRSLRHGSRNNLRALAIHEDTVRAALKGRDLFCELADGDDIPVGVLSPQRRDVKELMRWMLIDEAHLVDEDSEPFQNYYHTSS